MAESQADRISALERVVIRHEGRLGSLEGRYAVILGLQLAQLGALLGVLWRMWGG